MKLVSVIDAVFALWMAANAAAADLVESSIELNERGGSGCSV